jgi:hypothetical protein
VWTEQRWVGFEVDFIEPQPRSSAFVIDLVAVTGGGVVLPGGTIAAQLLNAIQVNANELAHLRFFVLDDIEAQLWQLSNMARFAPRGGQAGVNLMTPTYDPNLTTSTFWVLGGLGDKDARLGCFNLSGANLPMARIGFFGYRYILKQEKQADYIHPNARYVPAQGR